jgi:hypothetical protein
MTDLARRGIYALPAAGILTAVPWVLSLGSPSVKTDPAGYAHSLTSATHVVGGYLYLAGLICLLFGLLALYALLARTPIASWAGRGMIFSLLGIALALPAFGVTRLGDTVLADVYLDGHQGVSAALGLLPDLTLTYRTTTYFAVFVLISLVGAIASAVAVWKSGALPKWAGVLVGAGFWLSLTFSPGLAWVGALCLVIGGVWLARSVSQAPSTA